MSRAESSDVVPWRTYRSSAGHLPKSPVPEKLPPPGIDRGGDRNTCRAVPAGKGGLYAYEQIQVKSLQEGIPLLA